MYFKNLKALVTILWNIKDEEFGFAYAIYRDDCDSALNSTDFSLGNHLSTESLTTLMTTTRTALKALSHLCPSSPTTPYHLYFPPHFYWSKNMSVYIRKRLGGKNLIIEMSEVPPAPILHSGMKRWELNHKPLVLQTQQWHRGSTSLTCR